MAEVVGEETLKRYMHIIGSELGISVDYERITTIDIQNIISKIKELKWVELHFKYIAVAVHRYDKNLDPL